MNIQALEARLRKLRIDKYGNWAVIGARAIFERSDRSDNGGDSNADPNVVA